MTPHERSRDGTIVEFRKRARQIFHTRPELRSAILGVAQYWNDQADDEVHSVIVASPREVPVWPHFCEGYDDDDSLPTPGECCTKNCPDSLGFGFGLRVDWRAFEPYCHESGDQQEEVGHNYLPYAIARRSGEGVEVEVIGKLLRPVHEMIGDEPDAERPWLALPRAGDLYEQVCASPSDDAPRRVLADYLLEHDHPRGELIALSLAEQLDPAALARRDELLDEHGRRWISPLGAVIPAAGARWERGFLTRADVCVRGDAAAAVRGAPAWGSVEEIRFLGGTELIDPAMVALRDVGPVRDGVLDLAAAPRPWAIERLHAVLDDDAAVDVLWGAATLPRLSHLVLEGARAGAALSRPRPRWWPQLERLTLILGGEAGVDAQIERSAAHRGIAPWVAVTRRSAITGDLGWEIAVGPDGRGQLSLAGWHERASRHELQQLVLALPRELRLSLLPSPYWAPLAADGERLAVERLVRGGP